MVAYKDIEFLTSINMFNSNRHFKASKPEQRLLIATIAAAGPILAAKKTTATTVLKNELKTAIQDITDWEKTSLYIIKKGIAPILWYIYSNDKDIEAIIPEQDRLLYKNTYLKTLTRSMILYNAFQELMSELNKRKVKVVALKGIYLAETLYPQLGLRQFSDIDLLIKEENADEIAKTMKRMGYIQTESPYNKQVRERLENAHLPAFVKDGISVELHTKLHADLYDYKLTTSDFINRAIEYQLAANEIYILDPIDQIIHLCVHVDKHFYQSDLQFYSWMDIIVILWKNQIEWDELLERSWKYKAEKNVINQLKLINHVFNVPISLNQTTNSYLLSSLTISRIQQHLSGTATKIASIKAHRYYIKSIPDIKEKAEFIVEMLLPSKRVMLSSYKIPKSKYFWLWYPFRWWQFFRSYIELFKERKETK